MMGDPLIARRSWLRLFAATLTSSVRWQAFQAPSIASLVPVLGGRRPAYGGSARLQLPLPLDRLDPHDPSCLDSGLLGPAVFETLYAVTATGQPFPALASALPERVGTRFRIRLRPSMVFSDRQSLDGQSAVNSILRSQRFSQSLSELGKPRPVSGDQLSFEVTGSSSARIATVLSQPRAAIVPHHFVPTRPLGCGAFSARLRAETIELRRNPLAPRGGSYLDRVQIARSTVSDALRSFEATRSDFALFGSGLHQSRPGAIQLQLEKWANVVLVGSPGWSGVSRPGQLHAHLRHLPGGPFSALGVDRVRGGHARWGGASFSILVPRENRWLYEIALEIKGAWERSSGSIEVLPLSAVALSRRIASGNYDTYLTALCTSGVESRHRTADLFALAGVQAPRSGRNLSEEEACRQLRIGLVGSCRPALASSPQLTADVHGGALDLSNARRRL